MKHEQAIANVEFRHGGKAVKIKVLVDAGASKSVISKRLADEF
ncbi:MAG: hypothetical protein QXF46_03235 [Thermofilaceae archaeon]